MQMMVIEFARNVLGYHDANSREMDEKTPHNVIDIMEEQKNISNMGGTMRLGAYECVLDRKSTRLNSSHANISYAVFCLKKKKQNGRPMWSSPRPSTPGTPTPNSRLCKRRMTLIRASLPSPRPPTFPHFVLSNTCGRYL